MQMGFYGKNRFPEIGEINEEHANLHEYLRKAHNLGAIICLWTCRVDDTPDIDHLTKAIAACKENRIPIDYINDSPNEIGFERYHPRKIFAHEYIDDRAINISQFRDPSFINRRLSFIKDGQIKDATLNIAWKIILSNLNLPEDAVPMNDDIDDSQRVLILSKILQEREE